MNRDVKTLFLVALTLILYALSIFISSGVFVFPYPINPFIFFVIALLFAYRHGKKRKKRGMAILVILVGLFGILSSGVLWDLLLSIESIENLFAHDKAQWLKIIYGILIFIWGSSTLFMRRKAFPTLVTVIGLVLFCLGFFGIYDPYDIFIILAYTFIVLSNYIKPVLRPFHLLWILLLILEVSEWITLTLA
jgi:hypothetical protein